MTEVRDEAWVRVVDLPAALRQRALFGADQVTVRVDDPVIVANDRTWQFSAAGAIETQSPPQLEIDVHGLGSRLLGATSWRTLAAAGTVRVFESDALAAADRLFGSPGAPFSGIYF